MSNETILDQPDVEHLYFGLALEAQQQIPARLQSSRKRVIVIAGPTGSGKTTFGIRLAKDIGGEVISADSMQVYQGMDIGTAKPSEEQRKEVPHHLIDTRKINDHFNVVDFYYEARSCCQLILTREGTPIVVGGSGFYIHALIYGPPEGPPPEPELRAMLEEEVKKIGIEAMHERLRKMDPQYAGTVTKSDKQKIIRAIEIMTLTGKQVSRLGWKTRIRPLSYDYRCWFLHWPKTTLYERIDKRCDQMLEEGFLQEVERLDMLGIRKNQSASQAIGYRQALEYLDSPRTDRDYQHFVTTFKQASRNYAKRQLTWFRKEPLFRWIDLEAHDPEIVQDVICQDYNSR